MFKPKRVAKNL